MFLKLFLKFIEIILNLVLLFFFHNTVANIYKKLWFLIQEF